MVMRRTYLWGNYTFYVGGRMLSEPVRYLIRDRYSEIRYGRTVIDIF